MDNIREEDILKLKGPILVLGASGFVGANVFRKILKYRDDCYGVFHSEFNNWRLENISVKNLKKCDLTKIDELENLVNTVNPKTIFNFVAYGAYSRQDNVQKIHETNYLSTSNLLNSLKDKHIAAYVHAGSSSEYGLNCDKPKEFDILEPNSDYAVSKIACSYLIKYYGKVLNVPTINLRLYSVYGDWEEPDRLIPKLLVNGYDGKYPPFVSPEISRDFVYIDDVINAFVAAALKCDEYKGEDFNIATGQKTTIGELSQCSKKLFNIENEPIFSNMDNRNWDLKDWVGDFSKAKECLNWVPVVNLEDGLAKTKNWLENHLDFYKTFSPYNREFKDKISAIIACYKDAQAIPYMYGRLVNVFDKLNIDYEIIFVNDCSPDNSEEVILKLSENNPNVIGITHSRNFGSQAAFLSGMEISTGDAVVLLDGDLQDPPELIEEFYKKWKENYDVVYGVRVKREMSPFNEFFYKSFYQVFSFLADINIPKNAGDFSLIDKKVVNEMLSLPEKEVFLRGLRAWVGFKQIGIDYIRPERMFGVSTNNLVKNIWWAKKGIFSFSNKPIEYISYFSLLIFFVTIIAGFAQFMLKLYRPEMVPTGFTTIILLILLLGGIQLFAISIIGEYIAKITEETKGRPIFIRSGIISSNRNINKAESMEEFVNKRKNYN